CTPYDELSERAIKLRYSVLTGGDVPVLVLRIVQLEKLEYRRHDITAFRFDVFHYRAAGTKITIFMICGA
ncbi:hypothetical protein Q4S20_20080, partial [Morganella morganii]